ncbi:MAG TPA: hypothetical protein VHD36_08400, partial [Pirellulales bacterium]|nr:hypothetical protein [Pirellulales bacterium]
RIIATKSLVIVLMRACWMLPYLVLLRHIGVYPLTNSFWFSLIMAAWVALNVLAVLAGFAATRRWNRWEGLDLEAPRYGASDASPD